MIHPQGGMHIVLAVVAFLLVGTSRCMSPSGAVLLPELLMFGSRQDRP